MSLQGDGASGLISDAFAPFTGLRGTMLCFFRFVRPGQGSNGVMGLGQSANVNEHMSLLPNDANNDVSTQFYNSAGTLTNVSAGSYDANESWQCAAALCVSNNSRRTAISSSLPRVGSGGTRMGASDATALTPVNVWTGMSIGCLRWNNANATFLRTANRIAHATFFDRDIAQSEFYAIAAGQSPLDYGPVAYFPLDGRADCLVTGITLTEVGQPVYHPDQPRLRRGRLTLAFSRAAPAPTPPPTTGDHGFAGLAALTQGLTQGMTTAITSGITR